MKTIPHSFLLALASVTLCGMPALRAADTDPKIAEVTKLPRRRARGEFRALAPA